MTSDKKARILIITVIFSVVLVKLGQVINYSKSTTLASELKKVQPPIAKTSDQQKVANSITKTKVVEKPKLEDQNSIEQLLKIVPTALRGHLQTEDSAKEIAKPTTNEIYNKHGVGIANYVKLQAKALLKSDDRRELASQVENKDFIEGAAQILKFIPEKVANEDVIQHLNATRFLLSALTGKESDYTLKIIEGILHEGTIENNQISPPVRKFIAGDRAELIYGLLQFNSDSALAIKSSLPGPVSAKLFENVIKHRQVLLAEAATEFAQISKEFGSK